MTITPSQAAALKECGDAYREHRVFAMEDNMIEELESLGLIDDYHECITPFGLAALREWEGKKHAD